MRNHYEHFDEKVEDWWRNSKRHSKVDLNVMPQTAIGAPLDPIDVFRNFDPITKELWFWSERFNLQEVIDEARRLIPKLEGELAKVQRWRVPPAP